MEDILSEKEIRAALDEICSDLELKRTRGLLRPGTKAALFPMALGAAAMAAIACSAEPLLAEGGLDPTSTAGTGGTGGTGAGGPPGGGFGGAGAGTGTGGDTIEGCGGQGGAGGGCAGGAGGATAGGGGAGGDGA